jgi:Flp pilus assembly protein TadG
MRIRNTKNSESGQAAAEFVLIFPVLAIVLVTIIQFGGLYNHYESLTNATRAGARKAVVSRTATNPVSLAQQAVRDAAPNLNFSTAGASISVTPAPPWTPGQQVTVTATYPYSISIVGVSVSSGTLSSSTKERVE